MSKSNSDDDGASVKAPALPSDAEGKAFALDPQIGEEAFSRRAPSLRAMDPAGVTAPNCDATRAAMITLQVVKAAEEPSRAQAFAKVGEFLGDDTIATLKDQAWALWYLDSRVRTIDATKSDVKVDATLFEEASKARARVLKLVDYYLGENPKMAAELKDIGIGTGYIDLAGDLTRLAGHLSAHKDTLSADKMRYRADDEVTLRGMANAIIAQLNEDRTNETPDLRNRAWTQMRETYVHLKKAADFIFHKRPSDLARFPGLRAALMSNYSRVGRPPKTKSRDAGNDS
ncbi:MAG: hypothetical protein HOW73_34265 [Polyangiaceae bacterium]|nr:hypothetical protein [Polyangiaceae bacterium]